MADISSVTTGFFPETKEGFTTTTSGSVSSGAATVGLNSTTGYTNGAYVTMVIDPTDATKKQVFTGVMDTSGNQVTSVKWTEGTNVAHSAGATIVDYETATAWNLQRKGWKTEHNDNGTHAAVTATSVAATGNISSSAGTINTTLVSSLQDTSVALSTYRSESQTAFTASGGVWTGDAYASTKAASMTAWTGYINGQRGTISAVTARTFTASKDTYVDVLNTAGVFTLVYTEVNNNAASPALAANSLRLAIVVTGAANIAAATSINQGDLAAIVPVISSVKLSVTDSLGNLICNRTPNPTLIGYRQATADQTPVTTEVAATGLSCPVIIPAGRRVKIRSVNQAISSGAAGIGMTVKNYAGTAVSGTLLSSGAVYMPTAGTGNEVLTEAMTAAYSGSQTFSTSFTASGAGGTFGASSTAPTFIEVWLA